MAGYGNRSRPGEDVLHPIWAKAVALEDAQGERAVMITSDLLGFSRDVSNRIVERIEQQHGLARERVMLTASHTHSGPVISRALQDIYPVDDEGWTAIDRYTDRLEDQIVDVVDRALQAMEPALLSSGIGVTRFAVNRRNNPANLIEQLTELEGPSDHSVPVLKITSNDDDVLALVFGYACHATVLSGYEWSGDYPGFAQIELEKEFPGATALFFSGAGADQNPLPRRSIPLAEQYGRELAAAVVRATKEPMRELDPRLQAAYSEITLDLSEAPTSEDLRRQAEEASGSQQRWATRLHAALEAGASLPTDYPYPVQAWRLGDQLLVALGGEVVVDYAVDLKRLLGHDVFVVAYANDVMGYIPSVRVLREGGYEGATSQRVYGQPSTWAAPIELGIQSEVLRLAQTLGTEPPESPLE